MPALADLAGPPPGETPRVTVLRNYHTIAGARARGWRWRQIAEVLGLSEPALKKAFSRVRRHVESGQIDPEALKGPPPASKGGRASAPRALQPVRHPRPPSEQSNAAALAEMGVEIIGGDQQ